MYEEIIEELKADHEEKLKEMEAELEQVRGETRERMLERQKT